MEKEIGRLEGQLQKRGVGMVFARGSLEVGAGRQVKVGWSNVFKLGGQLVKGCGCRLQKRGAAVVSAAAWRCDLCCGQGAVTCRRRRCMCRCFRCLRSDPCATCTQLH